MSKSLLRLLLSSLLVLSLPAAATAAPDAIYLHGKVWTTEGDGRNGERFAQALATEGDLIVAVGTDAEITALAGSSTRKIDLAGRLVTPGFIDNHTHFLQGSLALSSVDLRDAGSPEEFARRIGARAKEQPGEWILQGNWDHELWNGRLPRRDWIDAVTGDTPVFVLRLDGHMGLANSAALKLAGIDAATADPAGGAIVRDADGRPTGLLKDSAMDAVMRVIPPPSETQIDAAIQGGFRDAVLHGVTQIHDMSDGDWRTFEALRRAKANGRLPIRAYAFVPIADWERLAGYIRANGRGDDWLRWGGVKGFVDGSLGSTTAWFHQPYSDAPQTSGLTMGDPATLATLIGEADRAGLHLAVHAIGDRANDWLLDAYQRIATTDGPKDRRFRIEHAQHLSPAAIARFGELGVIPSMQPYHAIDDGRWAEKRIGAKRLTGTYAFRSLLAAGAPLTFGSDWPVAPLDPLTGIDAAVNRRTIDGRNPNGWQPQERVTVAQALRSYTVANAHAGFQDKKVGRIAPGFLADFVILSDDLFSIDPGAILSVKVQRTVIGGQDAYVAAARD
ncbi:amidohydrolase family protein [Phenylobacterium sp. LjRoot225]|uniref:amidohydrolase n=1 Tax=Phenylobacterium sp. LjRoot225 TaxID=3342285 RepID=UPI003ECFE41A